LVGLIFGAIIGLLFTVPFSTSTSVKVSLGGVFGSMAGGATLGSLATCAYRRLNIFNQNSVTQVTDLREEVKADFKGTFAL
jgi:hypothetical protein